MISTLCFSCAVCGGYPNFQIYNFVFYIFIALLAAPITAATLLSTRLTDLYFSPFFCVECSTWRATSCAWTFSFPINSAVKGRHYAPIMASGLLFLHKRGQMNEFWHQHPSNGWSVPIGTHSACAWYRLMRSAWACWRFVWLKPETHGSNPSIVHTELGPLPGNNWSLC